jgi:ribonuclease Z
MTRYFDPQLVNGPFEDPGLYVDLVFQRRALLFDLGDISALTPRKLLRLEHVFITHRHMDHFIGFDQMLRCLLGREKTLSIWGPSGLVDAVECKLNAYNWNLIGGYEGNLVLRVMELGQVGRLATAQFSGANAFAREDLGSSRWDDGVLVAEPGFRVRSVMLDHRIPVLAFALEERASINIQRNKIEAMGLVVGPWLRAFKDAVVRGDRDDTPIAVVSADGTQSRPQHIPLGQLKSQIMKTSSGRKIAYVVDAAFTEPNAERIVALTADADILFIEATFLHADAACAAARNHLTARQAGLLARRANVRQLRTLHYSPRYQGRGTVLDEEAQAAFRGPDNCAERRGGSAAAS